MTAWLFIFVLLGILGGGCEATSDEERVNILESVIEQQSVEGEELRARIRDLERRIAELKAARLQRVQDSLKTKEVWNADEFTDKESDHTGSVIKRL